MPDERTERFVKRMKDGIRVLAEAQERAFDEVAREVAEAIVSDEDAEGGE